MKTAGGGFSSSRGSSSPAPASSFGSGAMGGGSAFGSSSSPAPSYGSNSMGGGSELNSFYDNVFNKVRA